MKNHLTTLVASTLGVFLLVAGCVTHQPAPIVIARGITRLASANIAGPVAADAAAWRTIVEGTLSDRPGTVPVALARSYGKGRVWLAGASFKPVQDGEAFTANLYRWLAGGTNGVIAYTTAHREWYQLDREPDGPIARRLGLSVGRLDGLITSNKLAGVSVLVVGIAWGELTPDEIETVRRFTENGGGLYLLGLGWSWLQSNSGKTPADFPMNKLAAPFGGKWLAGTVLNDQPYQPNPQTDGYTIFTRILGTPEFNQAASRSAEPPVATTPYLKQLTEALNQSPEDVGKLVNRGHVYASLGEWRLAMADYDKALKLQPDNAHLHWSLGWNLFNRGNAKQALLHWQQWIQKSQQRPPSAHHTLAIGYWATGQKYEALRHYDAAARQSPDWFSTKAGLLKYTEFWTRKERTTIEDIYDAWNRAFPAKASPAQQASTAKTSSSATSQSAGKSFPTKAAFIPIPNAPVPRIKHNARETIPKGMEVSQAQALAATEVKPDEAAAHVRTLRALVAKEPKNAEALYRLGCLLSWGTSAKEGLDCLDRAANLQPKDDRILSAQLQAALIRGDERDMSRLRKLALERARKGTSQPMLWAAAGFEEMDGMSVPERDQVVAAARDIPQLSAASMKVFGQEKRPAAGSEAMVAWAMEREQELSKGMSPSLIWDVYAIDFDHNEEEGGGLPKFQQKVRDAKLSATMKSRLLTISCIETAWSANNDNTGKWKLREAAVSALEEAVALDPKNVIARTVLGWNHEVLNAWDKAAGVLPTRMEVDGYFSALRSQAVPPLRFDKPVVACFSENWQGGWQVFQGGDLVERMIRNTWSLAQAGLLEHAGDHKAAVKLARFTPEAESLPMEDHVLAECDLAADHPLKRIAESLDLPSKKRLLDEKTFEALKQLADKGDGPGLLAAAKAVFQTNRICSVLGSYSAFPMPREGGDVEMSTLVLLGGGGNAGHSGDSRSYISPSGLFFCFDAECSRSDALHGGIFIRCKGFEREELAGDLAEYSVAVTPTIKLIPEGPEHKSTVKGRVLDPLGRALGGIEIEAWPYGGGKQSAVTDAGGCFGLTNLSEAKIYELGISLKEVGAGDDKQYEHTYLKRGETVDLGEIILRTDLTAKALFEVPGTNGDLIKGEVWLRDLPRPLYLSTLAAACPAEWPRLSVSNKTAILIANGIQTADGLASDTGCVRLSAGVNKLSWRLADGRVGKLEVLDVLPARQSPAPPELFENFEAYGRGGFPSPTWIAHANAQSDSQNNQLVQDPQHQNNTVLQLFGTTPGNWSALAFRRCAFPDSFELSFRAYVDEKYQDSPGGFSVQMRQEPDWQSHGRSLLQFAPEGKVALNDQFKADFSMKSWYEVRVTYRRSGTEVTVEAWLNWSRIGKITLPVEKAGLEDGLKYLCFDGRGRFFIDNVKLKRN